MDNIVRAYERFFIDHEGLLPLSANVDLILLLLGLKSCVRTQLQMQEFDKERLKSWCDKLGLEFVIKNYNLLYIAINKNVLDRAIILDHSLEPHEVYLGALLGYPPCCCEKIAEVGEMGIDPFEEWLSEQNFKGAFQLINTHLYRIGKAFISHVPCTTTCIKSLEIAQQVAIFFLSHKEERIFQPWLEELAVYASLDIMNITN